MSDLACIKVLSMDDHPLLRERIAAIVSSQPHLTLTDSRPSGTSGIDGLIAYAQDTLRRA